MSFLTQIHDYVGRPSESYRYAQEWHVYGIFVKIPMIHCIKPSSHFDQAIAGDPQPDGLPIFGIQIISKVKPIQIL